MYVYMRIKNKFFTCTSNGCLYFSKGAIFDSAKLRKKNPFE